MNQILDDHSIESVQAQTTARQFFSKVYLYMFGALLVSGAIAYQYGTPEFVQEYFLTEKGGIAPLLYVVAFAPIGIALLMGSIAQRASFITLFALFAAYSLVLGFGLTTIFLAYSVGSIVSTFFITAGSFAAMAILGYTTKVDLTRFGSLLYMAFFGIFIAGIINFFLDSEPLQYVISIIGVFVFTGLTAYSMQQLKTIAFDTSIPESERSKLALLGGFNLYVLFVNLFLSLLRLLGSRD
jgi:FtsH-binding integral membrane protein